jgi:hypothetical protein
MLAYSWSVFVPHLSCQAPVVHLAMFYYWADSSQHFDAFLIRIKQISVLGLLVPEDKGTTML